MPTAQGLRAGIPSPATVARRRYALACVQGHSFLPGLLGPEAVVLDLGASLGGFALTLSAMTGCRCHVVEAAPQNFARIEESERIAKHHYAVGGRDGPVALALADDGFHWGSLRPPVHVASLGTVTVPGITLATLVDRLALSRIDLMKVDIEGAEIALFEAAPDALLSAIPQITVEFHDFADPAQGPAVARALARFRRLGFAVLVMSRRGHGDVLLVNRTLTNLTPARLLWLGGPVKYGRGLARLFSRAFGRNGREGA